VIRLLADENFPLATVEALRTEGYDVFWVRTDDKDFWQIALQRKTPLNAGGVVLFRIHPATSAKLTAIALRVLRSPTDWAGHVCAVREQGVELISVKRVF
jgi:hypothetical protein